MDQERIGKFIAERRKEKGMTQEELAQKLDINNKTISRWETGKYMPDLSLFPLLSETLGVTVNDLMSGEVVDKKNYQSEFEKNVVTTMAEVDESNKRVDLIFNVVVGFFGCIVLFVVVSIFINNYNFSVKYSNGMIKVSQDRDRTIHYEISDRKISDTKYLIDYYVDSNDEKIGLIFISAKQTIANMFEQESVYDDCVVAYDCSGTRVSDSIVLNRYDDFPKKFKVYYTTYSFKSIVKSSNKQLKNILDNSHLIYENMGSDKTNK